MQQELRDAVRRLLPEQRRTHRQSWRRHEIRAGRIAACATLERVIDEAIEDGVPDAIVEQIALVMYDNIRRKLDARARRPLGIPSLGDFRDTVRDEQAVQGEMAPLEIEAVTSPTVGRLARLKECYLRHTAAIRRVVRAIDAQLEQLA